MRRTVWMDICDNSLAAASSHAAYFRSLARLSPWTAER